MSEAIRDALGRRSRHTPLSSGKRVTPQPRDLLWFQKLYEHGPLSSTYLHAFSRHLAKNEKRSRDRLTDLFNESHTPHGGAYLVRPWQQFQTFDARYQDLVYDIGAPAEAALKEHGLLHEHGASAGGPWRHRFMVAAITASIELAALAEPALRFIPQRDILDRANTTLRYPVPIEDPVSGRQMRSDLIPDAVFGLEYKKGNVSAFRFFVVEADRGTEPSRASSFNRKSHLRNLLQYRDYIGRALYQKHLDLSASILVLNVVTSEATMANVLSLAREVSPRGSTYQLFRCAPQFGRYFKPAHPTGEFLHGAWTRPNASDFVIAVR